MSAKRRVRIDLDKVLKTLRSGVHRADIFMGMGLNAAGQNPPPSHVLAPEGSHSIQLVKQELNDAERAHVAEEFGKWIKANGLRELMETFSIFLHELYMVLFILFKHRNKIDQFPSVAPNSFEKMGIGKQMETLSEVITIPPTDIRIIRSLNDARNCYAHRRGLVGQTDVDGTRGALILRWSAIKLEVVEPNGNKILEPDFYGRKLEKGGKIHWQVAEVTKEIKLNEEITLSKRELKEICLCVAFIGDRLFKEVVELGEREGIVTRIHATPTAPQPG